jgi:REP element-mobilizing transposase RayT
MNRCLGQMKRHSPLKPVKDLQIYKKHLPHWDLPGSVYFITFSTVKGFELTDAAKDIVLSSIKFHAAKKYTLYACVVMATHVHCILQPQETVRAGTPVLPGNFYSLAQILHSIKSYSANRIQKRLGWKGSVWQNENYDRVVRDEKAFQAEMNYIIGNPVRDGIVENPKDYRWLYWVGIDEPRTSRDARATK